MNLRLVLPAALSLVLTACASTPTDPATARANNDNQQGCQSSIGSSICRRDNGGVQGPSNTISGDALRRAGTITGAQPGVIPD